MKKKLLIFIVVFTLFLPIITKAKANDNIIEKQFEMLDKAEFDSFIKQLNSNYGDYIPQYELKDLIKTIRGQKLMTSRFIKGITGYFFHEILTNLRLLGELLTLSIICAILKSIQSAFENDNIGKVTHGFTFLVMIVIAIQSFNLALKVGKNAIDQMVSVIQALLPVVLTLLASIGGITSVAVFNPLIFIGISVSSTWIRNILLPMIYFVAALGLISNISDRFHVSALSSF